MISKERQNWGPSYDIETGLPNSLKPSEKPPRDLMAEVRAARRERAHEEVKCEFCGKKTRYGALRSHQKTLECTAERNSQEMRDLDYRRIENGSFAYNVLTKAGLEPLIKSAQTHYERARKHRKASLRYETWAPSWAQSLLNDSYELTRGFSNDEAVPLYAIVVKQMHDEPDIMEAVFAAKRMSGHQGVRGFVFTPKIRAAKLRKEAAELLQRASEKETEANELDPVGGG